MNDFARPTSAKRLLSLVIVDCQQHLFFKCILFVFFFSRRRRRRRRSFEYLRVAFNIYRYIRQQIGIFFHMEIIFFLLFFGLHSNGMKKNCKTHIHTFILTATSQTVYRIKCIKTEKRKRTEWTANCEICRNLNEFINIFFVSFFISIQIKLLQSPSECRIPNAECRMQKCSPRRERENENEQKKLFNCQTI